MIDTTVLLAVYGAFVIGLISPGPDLVLVTAMSLRQGRAAAILAACGIALGVGLWVLAAAAGVGEVMTAAPEVWQGVRLLAGGILIYMGARALSAAIRDVPAPEPEDNQTKGSPFVAGLLTNLGNPKAAVVLVGLTAVLSDAVAGTDTLLAAVLGMPLLTVIWFVSVATVLSHSRVRQALLVHQRLLDVATGAALAGVGAYLLQTIQTA